MVAQPCRTDGSISPRLFKKNIREYVIIESTYLDRNVTYSYNQNIALSIISQAKEKFYDMFCLLKKEIDEIGYKKIRQTQKCNAGFFYLLYYYEICITDILSPNFLSNLLNKSHLLPLIFIS